MSDVHHEPAVLSDRGQPRKILLFPMVNRVAKIRHAANQLAEKGTGSGELYRRQLVSAMRKQLFRVGLSEGEAEAEIGTFMDAVAAELVRRICEDTKNR